MSCFALSRRFTACLTPALLLATTSGPAMAQGSAAPVLIGTTAAIEGNTYSNADRVASTLLAGGVSRLAAIRSQQGSVAAPYNWALPVTAPDVVINVQRIGAFQGKLPGWQLQGVHLTLATPAISYSQPDLVPAALRGLIPALVPPAAPPAHPSGTVWRPCKPEGSEES